MRGVVIAPGETLSINEEIGRRTAAKGFLQDGAISGGVIVKSYGGGISQFITTFFNASFFGGLDLDTYQAHTLDISRYPQGLEATISWGGPEHIVTNNTDYGILIWPEYEGWKDGPPDKEFDANREYLGLESGELLTDRSHYQNTRGADSITVTFYSTKNIEVEALPQIRSKNQFCTVFRTPRLRNGVEDEEPVFAQYRPSEGLNCNGTKTQKALEEEAKNNPPEPEGPTVTIQPPPTQPTQTAPPITSRPSPTVTVSPTVIIPDVF